MLGPLELGISAQAPSDQQDSQDPDRSDHRRPERQREVARPAEDAGPKPNPKEDQHESTDGGVEEAQIELADRDDLRRHAEAVKNSPSDSHPTDRATRHN